MCTIDPTRYLIWPPVILEIDDLSDSFEVRIRYTTLSLNIRTAFVEH